VAAEIAPRSRLPGIVRVIVVGIVFRDHLASGGAERSIQSFDRLVLAVSRIGGERRWYVAFVLGKVRGVEGRVDFTVVFASRQVALLFRPWLALSVHSVLLVFCWLGLQRPVTILSIPGVELLR